MNKKKVWVGIIALLIVVAGFFMFNGNSIESESVNVEEKKSSTLDATWRHTVLEDINTGESYKVSDFLGKPVLVESFAVWCPTCTKQQQEVGKFHDMVGDEVVSISLDTDPNEDVSKIEEHLERNGFSWRYSVAPVELTKSLIDDFGQNVVNAPQAPVILVCADGSASQLPRGVKSAEELQEFISQRCG